ncbi:hypothetical protein CDD83_1281 [Cordyceps sp. RAO-2017]|nr:hypothetical protein CDD83_1281 [Cordyceps sp. RAO-2017]
MASCARLHHAASVPAGRWASGYGLDAAPGKKKLGTYDLVRPRMRKGYSFCASSFKLDQIGAALAIELEDPPPTPVFFLFPRPGVPFTGPVQAVRAARAEA